MSGNSTFITKTEFINTLIQKYKTNSNENKIYDIITKSVIGNIIEDKINYNAIDISIANDYLKNSLKSLLHFSQGVRKAYVKPAVVHRMGLNSISRDVDSRTNYHTGFTTANKYNRLYF